MTKRDGQRSAGPSRRRFLALGGGALGALGLGVRRMPAASAAVEGIPDAAGSAVVDPVNLRAAAMTNPLGIDFEQPTLSWRLEPAARHPAGPATVQQAYQIQVASSEPRLLGGQPDLWDSGRIRSSQTYSVEYGGARVPSRTRALWRVRVWDGAGHASDWSAPAWWEAGLLAASDWSAHWLGNAEWEKPHPLVTAVTPQAARFVRMTITDLGRPASALDDAVNWKPQLQLAAVQIVSSTDPETDLARGATVTASDSLDVAGQWAPQYLVDGKLTSIDAPYGYQSTVQADTDVGDNPIAITLDLGAARSFDTLVVYPRWDAPSQWGITPDYPRSYSFAVADSASGPFTQIATVKKDDKPYPPSSLHPAPPGLPLFAKRFTADAGVEQARLYVSAAGIQIASVNGIAATDAVLEPPNSNVRAEVQYATYDVTDLLVPGANVVGVELGNGIWNIFNTPDDPNRYVKATAANGPPRVIAQLEINYRNGRTHTVATDDSWLTSLGPTTFSNWYGGEDFDARRVQRDWNAPAGDLTGWSAAVITAPPAPGTALVGRQAPPVEVVDVHPAKAITSPSPGVYVIDFGVNAAGRQQLRFSGTAGTKVAMYPGERLKSTGVVDQATTGAPIYDSYTLSGAGVEVWHPRFVYHGLRYLEVRGLAQAPQLGDANMLVLRTANSSASHFTSSHDLINSIHTIIDRAVQSNMYSVFTDCPHREKLGWLDDVGLIFAVASRNYDVEAYYRKIVRDIAEAQTPAGMVPTIAPEITLFAGAFRDDANWGSTLISAPWQQYRAYGDMTTLRTHYPAMQAYLDYLDRIAVGDLLTKGLGDWIALDVSTPVGLAVSYAYKRATAALAAIAGLIGENADAATYTARAQQITAAFNAQYHNAAAHSYASGSQASNALALDGGFVPDADIPAVLDTLIAGIRATGNHLQVGEVGLPAVFRVLAEHGRHDVIYDIATQTDYPSYGHQVLTGSTSLGESWGGMGTNNSQNHWMLGAIDEWFTAGLGGIDQAADSVAFRDLVLAPAVVGELTQVSASYVTPNGTVSTQWRRDHLSLSLQVTIPPNTTATVVVPVGVVGGSSARVVAPAAAVQTARDEAAVSYRVGPGSYMFTATAG